MHFKGGFPVMSALVLLCVTQVHSVPQLMCYVCDNCAQINTDTPQFLCDASFFATTGPTLPSTMTTTEANTTPLATPPSTMAMDSSTTTPPNTSSSTTTETLTTVTEAATPADTTTAESTEAPVPTPPTIGPPVTTTAMPTPTNQGTVVIPVDSVTAQMNAAAAELATAATPTSGNATNATNATKTYVPSSELRVRQTRRALQTDVTYHCYRVQRSDNGTMVSDRGCSRVSSAQGVCSQLQLASNTSSDKPNKCFACSTKLCNGSSALSVSALALLVGVVAVILRQ